MIKGKTHCRGTRRDILRTNAANARRKVRGQAAYSPTQCDGNQAAIEEA